MNEREELLKLDEEIKKHNRAYYENDAPLIPDYEYDRLLKRLEALEAKYPELASADSPVKTVGGRALPGFGSLRHEVALDSLQSVFSQDELLAFDQRLKALIERPVYVLEPKIDGLSVALTYENGSLTVGATRGDGQVGEDVTQNLLTIKNLPKQIDYTSGRLIVRGEVYMPKPVFEELNARREEEGLRLLANPRNAAAGSMRQLDAAVTASRRLSLIVFNIQLIEGKSFEAHSESLDFLKQTGFPLVPYELFSDMAEGFTRIEEMDRLRHEFDYVIDGAVIKLNSLQGRSRLGSTAKFPRWAVAYKYAPEVKETTVENIYVQVGRTGAITPKAVLAPVRLAGTTVTNATLHNQDFISQKDIRVGDTVRVRKAGEIIPEIIEVNFDKRRPGAQPYTLPEFCPECGSPTKRDEEGAVLRCTGLYCPAQLLRSLVHFCSKSAMDIEGFGEAVLTLLMDKGLVSSPADLYTLDFDKVSELENMGKVSAAKLERAVETSKSSELYRLIHAFGIRQVGEKASKVLAKKYGSLDKLMSATEEELQQTRDIGAVTAKNLRLWFSDPKSIELIDRLKSAGVNMKSGDTESDLRFEGMSFVLTGALESLSRKEAEEIIERLGGRASSSVSKNTSVVVAGENAGSKLQRAEALGLKIISEREFLDMSGQGEAEAPLG